MNKFEKSPGKSGRKARGTMQWTDLPLPAGEKPATKPEQPLSQEIPSPTVIARIGLRQVLPEELVTYKIEQLLTANNVEAALTLTINYQITLSPELQRRTADLCVRKFLQIAQSGAVPLPEPQTEKDLNVWLKRAVNYYLGANYPQGIWEAAEAMLKANRLVESNFLASAFLNRDLD